MKTIALIPARGGSKRVQNKNVLGLGNKPLLWYSVEAAKRTPEIDEVYVSSESRPILELAEHYGVNALKRPLELARDNSTDYDVINHFFYKVLDCKTLIYLRPTTPFRKIIHISGAIYQFEQLRSEYSSLRSIHKMSESAFKCCTMNLDNVLFGIHQEEFNNPNQHYPVTYQPNGYVDIIPSVNILDHEIWGSRIYGYVTPRVTELDTPADYKQLQMELYANGGTHVFE